MPEESTPRAWVLPDEPTPIRLMSTVWADTAGIHDDLGSAADLEQWLDAVGAPRAGARATDEDLAAAVRFRDAVRRLAAHATGDQRIGARSAIADLDEAVSALNAAAASQPAPRIALRGDGFARVEPEPGSGVSAGLAAVADETITLLTEGASGLRACYAPGCVLYFVKSHPRREWCSVACGNRARAVRHYDKVRVRRGDA
ncbi:ABATE domain-containing protein [Actinoplanes sp. NPDC051411]|uniref:CGNR zinc finger domain-containing protein n=1 Tax=Actinoplanes sp. NPDC051411 TaxID=3155522 RepID=UPI00341357C6